MFALYEPEVRSRRDEVLVRRAGPGDVADIAAIAATRGEVPGTFVDSVRSRIEDPGSCVLVAVVPGVAEAHSDWDRSAATGAISTAAGWAMVTRWPDGDGCPEGFYVSALTVAPAYRRRGFAEQLLRTLLRWTSARSGTLGSIVNVRNQPSVALHARLGFTEVARGASFAGITFEGGLGLRLAADLTGSASEAGA